MPKVLFTLLKSPFEKNEIRTMEAISGDHERGVMLLEDAVYYATSERIREELLSKNFSVFVIDEELKARGYEGLDFEGIEVIDYDSAVEIIMERCDKVVSL